MMCFCLPQGNEQPKGHTTKITSPSLTNESCEDKENNVKKLNYNKVLKILHQNGYLVWMNNWLAWKLVNYVLSSHATTTHDDCYNLTTTTDVGYYILVINSFDHSQ